MKFFSKKFATFAAGILTTLALSGTAQATSVLDYSGNYTGSSNPGIGLELTSSGTFQTIGGAAVTSFLNWASFLPVTDAVGKVKISGVNLTGSAFAFAPGQILQQTTGGQVDFFDAADNLLLAINFSSGSLLVTSVGTGSQFTVGGAVFSGMLSQFFVPTSASHSLSLIDFGPAAIGANGSLAAASGFGNGLVAGDKAVPEPATMILFGSGLLAAMRSRRRSA